MSYSQEIESCLAAAVGGAGLAEAELAEDLQARLTEPDAFRLVAEVAQHLGIVRIDDRWIDVDGNHLIRSGHGRFDDTPSGTSFEGG